MGLFDFLRSKKRRNKTAAEPAEPLELSGVDPDEIVPPETRYTREYREYLAEREAAEAEARQADAPAADPDRETESGK